MCCLCAAAHSCASVIYVGFLPLEDADTKLHVVNRRRTPCYFNWNGKFIHLVIQAYFTAACARLLLQHLKARNSVTCPPEIGRS